MSKKKINAEIIADSVSPQGHRITTMLLTYPRFIHGELLTHRMFSRNSASSRAIPFEKMVKMVEEDPFIPIAWQKSHKGMQGTEYFTDILDIEYADYHWREAAIKAVEHATRLNKRGVTKQLCNRLLEPFMWHQTLVTATQFENFFELRCPKYYMFNINHPYTYSWKDYIENADSNEKERLSNFSLLQRIMLSKSQAEIHIQALAESMYDAMNESIPRSLKERDWHIPFGNRIDIDLFQCLFSEMDSLMIEENNKNYLEARIKISVARAARLSYSTHDGEINYEKDIALHDQLLKHKHLSCFEHSAKVMTTAEYSQFDKAHPRIIGGKQSNYFVDIEQGWCNNFRGFVSYRYLIENNEH